MLKHFFFASFILFFLIVLPAKAEVLDSDKDGLSDVDEIYIYHTDPQLPDTDGDGYLDNQEISKGFSPLIANKQLKEVDSDNDGLNDAQELILGTDLGKVDTDGDGHLDGSEVDTGFDPLSPNTEKIAKKIEIDLKTQTLVYYFGDKKMDEFLISSGIPSLPTPKGQFKVLKKKPIVNYSGPGYYLPNTKWNLLFTYKGGLGVFVHGAYWHHNFGHPMSHGCINVAYSDMEDLYNFSEVGTKIVIR